jgi:transposase
MDANGLLISMPIFPGNTSDTKTVRRVMKDIKESYDLGRIIVVADKGLNLSRNIDVITIA